MKSLQKSMVFIVSSSLSLPVLASGLDSPSGPNDASSAMYTLEDIYNRLEGTEAAAPTGFNQPPSGTITGTGKTLTEVYNKVNEVMKFVPTCLPPKALNGTRWCDNNNGTVTDMTTGLVWLQNAGWGGEKQWDGNNHDNAHVRASELENGIAGLSDGSQNGDWRLPTKSELVGITTGDESVSSSEMRAFSGVESGYYWSSTCHASDTSYAWIVYLGNGGVDVDDKAGSNYVWPVRAGV